MDGGLLGADAVDEVLACAAENDLAGYRDLGKVVVAVGTGFGVGVIEDDGDAGFGYARLASFVDEILHPIH